MKEYLGSIYFDVKWFSENDFYILRCLLRRKIVVKGKYLSFNRKFFFNFRKMVYDFENRKSFSDFEHLILKLTYPVKARLGPCRELTGTCPGPAWDSPKTCLRLDWDPLGNWPGFTQDLTRTCPGLHRNSLGTSSRPARDLSGTYPGLTWDFIGICLGLVRDLPRTRQGHDRDPPGTWSRPARDLTKICLGLYWDFPWTWLGPARDFTGTCPGLV